ncbi:hypothetical protein [Catenulispora subtropica]|uniref:Uncharacterized protein n=1 Tax=Catenulispora subtropica TaxID=450798 RepID=A0ABP5CDS7_9ACTN
MTIMIHYDYVSWEKLFPGYGVDLSALSFEPPDDCRAGAEAALKHLRMGRNPKPHKVAEMRGCLTEALAEAVDLQCGYAAVLFPKPKRSADHLWMEFTAYDNTAASLTPIDILRHDILEPAPGEAVVHGPSRIDLACGPALRMLQTAERASDGTTTRTFPRLTFCGTGSLGSTLFVIRSRASSEDLTDLLDELVTAWAQGLELPG